MSRSMYGLHKAIGGFEKRRREALQRLPDEVCHFKVCQRPAAGFVENWAAQLFPVCRTHLEQGRGLGYGIVEPPKPETKGTT